jgi:hypothetical protein
MNAVAQWLVVLAIVVVCAAYAVRALLPAGVRRSLARRLRARGRDEWARGLEAGGGGCNACASAHGAPKAEGGSTKTGCG